MARERSDMRRIKEVLRLHLLFALSHRAISQACRMPRTTVRDYCQRAKAAGIDSLEDLDSLGESALEARLFTRVAQPDPHTKAVAPPAPTARPMPDWPYVHRELKKPGVTRMLLWKEYLGQHPAGYRYTQFTQLYKAWLEGHVEPRMRRHHRPGEAIEVDYAGMMLPIRIGDTIRMASVFTACLPYSDYLYAEATWTQQAEDWLASHVRLFAHLGGVPAKLVPDNLKTGITHACFFDPVVNRDYLELARHYRVAVLPTRTRRPRDKASAENGVQQIERRVLAPLRQRRFGSLEEANAALAHQLGTHPVWTALLGLGVGEIDTGLLERPGSCSCLDLRLSRTRWWPARAGPGRLGRSVPLSTKRSGPQARSLRWRAATGSRRAFCSDGDANSCSRSDPPNAHPSRPSSR